MFYNLFCKKYSGVYTIWLLKHTDSAFIANFINEKVVVSEFYKFFVRYISEKFILMCVVTISIFYWNLPMTWKFFIQIGELILSDVWDNELSKVVKSIYQ